MKKYLFSLLLFSLFFTIKSQTWCPPGATWHYGVYNNNYPYYSGILELNYTNTVMVNSITCKQIIGTYKGVIGFLTSSVTVNNYVNIKTYENNNVVYRYDPVDLDFDTLANFNANIGDKWQLIEFPKQSPNTCTYTPMVTVIDTGHTIINSQNLKRIVISYSIWGNLYKDTILERISTISNFIHPYYHCIIDGPYFGKFICYEDNSFPIYKKGVTTCDYDGTNVNEINSRSNNLIIYPNPAGDYIRLELEDMNSDDMHLKVKNVIGQEIRLNAIEFKNLKNQLNIKDLKPGIYFIEIWDSNKRLASQKLIKE